MHSMTGFGTGKSQIDGREITVEIKTVNHRFLDINPKMPKSLSFLESVVREEVQKTISRGHLELYVLYKNDREDSKSVDVDKALLDQYITALKEIGMDYCLSLDITYNDVLRMQGVFTLSEQEDNQQAITEVFKEAFAIGINGLVAMRKAEGENLYKDIKARINNLKTMFKTVVDEAPKVPIEHMEKLKGRMADILGVVEYDEARLLTEVAIFSDKCNIDEEIARFNSHIMQFEKTMDKDEPVGRKLDFTLQEINREVNTIGSKANNTVIANAVMDIKAELEKIREQVQNVE